MQWEASKKFVADIRFIKFIFNKEEHKKEEQKFFKKFSSEKRNTDFLIYNLKNAYQKILKFNITKILQNNYENVTY